MEIQSREPCYGDNYKAGYIGFSFNDASVVSNGIAYLTRWTRMSEVKVSHALVVAGDGVCIEAQMKTGVAEQPLANYFDDPHYHLFFRKPRGYTPDIGGRIAAAAKGQVGAGYDKWLIVAQAMQGCFLGRWVRAVFGDKPDERVSRFLNRPDKWICSELAAYALDAQPEYRDKGVLKKPDFTIDPQELFEDAELFEAWHDGLA